MHKLIAFMFIFFLCTVAVSHASSRNSDFSGKYASSKFKPHYFTVSDDGKDENGSNKITHEINSKMIIPVGTSWMKLKIDVVHLPSENTGPFSIRVLDQKNEVVGFTTSKMLLEDGYEEVLIDLARHPTLSQVLKMEIEHGKELTGAIFYIEYFDKRSAASAVSPIGKWNTIPVTSAKENPKYGDLIERSETGVGRLYTLDSEKHPLGTKYAQYVHGYCSGFLIKNNRATDKGKLFVTNNHCISKQKTCDSTIISFGFQRDSVGKLNSSSNASCSKIVYTNPFLDITIIRLNTSNINSRDRHEFSLVDFVPVLSVGQNPEDYVRDTILIQHPAGWNKQVDFPLSCRIQLGLLENGFAKKSSHIKKVASRDLIHSCDTQNGSSGSPLMDALTGKVLGVHFHGTAFGGYERDKNRNSRAYNRAISSHSILKCIKYNAVSGIQIDTNTGDIVEVDSEDVLCDL